MRSGKECWTSKPERYLFFRYAHLLHLFFVKSFTVLTFYLYLLCGSLLQLWFLLLKIFFLEVDWESEILTVAFSVNELSTDLWTEWIAINKRRERW